MSEAGKCAGGDGSVRQLRNGSKEGMRMESGGTEKQKRIGGLLRRGRRAALANSAGQGTPKLVRGAVWTVYWRDYTSDTYLYGSEIAFLSSDDVQFRNDLMPPGTVIKRWYSRVNYQAKRIEPTLPLIDGEGTYHIAMDADCDVEGGLLLRLSFLGKSGEEEGNFVLDGTESDFRCPLKTYSYEAQLICAGAHAFHFHSFTITELIHEE